MIKVNNGIAKATEFTQFKKKQNVSDDELLFSVLHFVTALEKQNGIIFHCLVRNYSDEYANVLFAKSMEDLKNLKNNLGKLPKAKAFFELVDMSSVKIEYHEIQKENFKIPSSFSCIEKGVFSLKDENNFSKLQHISDNIENEYLINFENTRAHFIGAIDKNRYSEVTFGNTLAKTKQICMGYFENKYCMELLDIADDTTMKLDFWYLIG